MFTFEFDHPDWLSQLYSEWRQTSKLVNLKISANVRVIRSFSHSEILTNIVIYDIGQNFRMTKTSYFGSFHQENTCKSCLHLNFIILTDFHSFTVNEDKLQN